MTEEEPIHAYCLDCGKKFNDSQFASSAWFNSNQAAPCNTCGGVVAILGESKAAEAIAKNQRSRGITRDVRPRPGDEETGAVLNDA